MIWPKDVSFVTIQIYSMKWDGNPGVAANNDSSLVIIYRKIMTHLGE